MQGLTLLLLVTKGTSKWFRAAMAGGCVQLCSCFSKDPVHVSVCSCPCVWQVKELSRSCSAPVPLIHCLYSWLGFFFLLLFTCFRENYFLSKSIFFTLGLTLKIKCLSCPFANFLFFFHLVYFFPFLLPLSISFPWDCVHSVFLLCQCCHGFHCCGPLTPGVCQSCCSTGIRGQTALLTVLGAQGPSSAAEHRCSQMTWSAITAQDS